MTLHFCKGLHLSNKKCRHNGSLDCDHDICPADDADFSDAVDEWLYSGRTPRAIEISPTFGFGQHDYHQLPVAIAEMAVCAGDNEDLILEYWLQGKMNYQICAALRKMRREYYRRCYSED